MGKSRKHVNARPVRRKQFGDSAGSHWKELSDGALSYYHLSLAEVQVVRCYLASQIREATELYRCALKWPEKTKALQTRVRSFRERLDQWPHATTLECDEDQLHVLKAKVVWCLDHVDQALTDVESADKEAVLGLIRVIQMHLGAESSRILGYPTGDQ